MSIGSALSQPATPQHPNDLAWLSELVHALSEHPLTLEQVARFLGTDAGASQFNAPRRRLTPHSPLFASIQIYPLPHIAIEVAVDIEFAQNAPPDRVALERAVGPLTPMPRRPDDFSSGDTLSHYRRGTHKTTRVFVELDPRNPNLVVKLHVDAE